MATELHKGFPKRLLLRQRRQSSTLASVQQIVLFSAEAMNRIETQTTKGNITLKNLPVMWGLREISEALPTEYPICLPGHKNCCCPSNLAQPKTRTPFG